MHPTIATHVPDYATCERIGWLFMAHDLQPWYDAYRALRGPRYANEALDAEIGKVTTQALNCRRWEETSLAATMWADIAQGFERRLAALQAVRTTPAAVAA